MPKRLSEITAKDLLGIRNEKCPNCHRIIIKAKAMANRLVFCDFNCMIEYDNKKEEI